LCFLISSVLVRSQCLVTPLDGFSKLSDAVKLLLVRWVGLLWVSLESVTLLWVSLESVSVLLVRLWWCWNKRTESVVDLFGEI
jgi:hypothetical protein